MTHFCLKYYMNANDMKNMPPFLNELIRSSGVGHFLLCPGKRERLGSALLMNQSKVE